MRLLLTGRFAVVLIGLLAASASLALGVPLTHDFTGKGDFCYYGGGCRSKDYWGTVTVQATETIQSPDLMIRTLLTTIGDGFTQISISIGIRAPIR